MKKQTIAILTALTLSGPTLSGCALFWVGGAGAAGYYVGKDKRPVRTMSNDAAITTAVNLKFVEDKYVSMMDIDVDTYGGVVTLTGTVPDAQTAQRAINLARYVSGVKRVESRLVVAGN